MNMDFMRIQNQTKKPRGLGCEAITGTLGFIYSFVLDTQELDSSHLHLTLVLQSLEKFCLSSLPHFEKKSVRLTCHQILSFGYHLLSSGVSVVEWPLTHIQLLRLVISCKMPNCRLLKYV